MGNHEWDDEKIEQLLSNAPKIKDERSMDDVLARLKNDPRLMVPEKKKKRRRWIPASISAAAVVTMAILVSSFYNGSNSGLQEFSTNDAAGDVSEPAQMKQIGEEEPSQDGSSYDLDLNASEANSITALTESETYPHWAVYQTDLDDYTPFHLGVSSQAEPIPVTFLISNDKIVQDLKKKDPSDLELYREYADDIHETAYGFNEYHPIPGSFKEEGDLIIHILPKDHGFDKGSASESMYLKIMDLTFYDYHQYKVLNSDGTEVGFSHTGKLGPQTFSNGNFAKAYYLFTLEDGQTVLAPWFWDEHDSLESALNAMKESKSDFYKSVIPENIDFTVTEELGLVRVKFKEPLDLLSMSPEDAGRMIEGMMLTGASFQTAIKFENIIQMEWNDFNFSEPLPIPIGPNPFYLNG